MKFRPLALGLALAFLAAGCDSGRPPPSNKEPVPAVQALAAKLVISPGTGFAVLGGEVELVALVTDAAGQALPGAHVDWLLSGGEAVAAVLLDGQGQPSTHHASGISDAQGQVAQRLRADKPGPVRVYAVLQSGAGKPPLLAQAEASWLNARLEVPARAELDRTEGGVLSTRVLRADGRPLVGYRVHWSLDDPHTGQFQESGGAEATSHTDAEGVARIRLRAPDGQAPDGKPLAARVNIALERPERQACQCSQLPAMRLAAGQTRFNWLSAAAKGRIAEPEPVVPAPAQAEAAGAVPTPAPASAPLLPARPAARSPQLHLALSCPPAVDVGQRVEYEMLLSNRGPGQAREVRVLDLLPPGLRHDSGKSELEWRVARLNAGETVKARVWAQAVLAGQYQNQARVQGQDAAAVCPILIRQAALSLVKEGPAERYLGQTSRYQIRVHNAGDGGARHVMLGDAYPQGLRFVSASPMARHDAEKRQLTWSLGNLAAGASRDIEVEFRSEGLGRLCNEARVLAEAGLESQAGTCTQVKGLTALRLEVVDDPDPVLLGASATYRIEVLNQGSAAATRVSVQGSLPEALRFLEADGPGQAVVEGRVIRFSPLPSLAPGEKAVYQVRARAEREGDVRFAVEILANELSAPVRETESTRLYQ